jgi:hypothetical protein
VAKKDKNGKGKGKVPKTIAGIKVPKALRKGLAGSFLESPRTREILADVIMAAAGAAAAALVKNRPSGQQVAQAGEAALEAGSGVAATARDTVQSAASAVTEAVAEGARQVLPSSMTKSDDEDAGKQETYAHLAGEDRKGKKDKQRQKPSNH